MTSLLKRFDEKFGCKEQNCCNGKNMADHFTIAEMQTWLHAALLEMKGKMEAQKVEVTDCDHNPMSASCDSKCVTQKWDRATNAAIDDCLAILAPVLEE